jgi:predicted kinase
MCKIHIVFGPLGAGKSTYARQLSMNEKATCFSIDNWMVDLFSPDSPEPLNLPWVMERVKRCEQRIWLTARDVARNGGNVVLDLGFMTVAGRTEFLDLASEVGLETQLHFITASQDTRRARVMLRNESKGETFAMEVTPSMFDFMDKRFETPTQEELFLATIGNTEVPS